MVVPKHLRMTKDACGLLRTLPLMCRGFCGESRMAAGACGGDPRTSKPSAGQCSCPGWVRLPCRSATRGETLDSFRDRPGRHRRRGARRRHRRAESADGQEDGEAERQAGADASQAVRQEDQVGGKDDPVLLHPHVPRVQDPGPDHPQDPEALSGCRLQDRRIDGPEGRLCLRRHGGPSSRVHRGRAARDRPGPERRRKRRSSSSCPKGRRAPDARPREASRTCRPAAPLLRPRPHNDRRRGPPRRHGASPAQRHDGLSGRRGSRSPLSSVACRRRGGARGRSPRPAREAGRSQVARRS